MNFRASLNTQRSASMCWLITLLGSVSIAAGETKQNPSFTERYPRDELQRILLPTSQWHPVPNARQRPAWEQLPKDLRDMLVAQGEACAAMQIPHLSATLYLQFKRSGNRTRYQDAWMLRRKLLNTLALAECVEGKGRFLDALSDVAWAICEESSWTWPAHVGRQKAGSGLPDTLEPVVAILSAETASSLAWVVYLLEEQLDRVSPQICRRIRREIDRQILSPYLERDDFNWMGFKGRGRPNNWNAWINANVLTAALLLEQDESRRIDIVHKTLRSIDKYYVPYPADGGCDEGPHYWTRAGACLFEYLDLLHSATAQRFDVFKDETVANIGRYIYRTHIGGDSWVSVGDSDARNDIPRDLVFRYGRRIADAHMQALGTFDLSGNLLERESRGYWSMRRPLYALLNASALRAANAGSAPLIRDVWLGDVDIQLMVARDTAGSSDGICVAAWGSHNAQSHNHNDVGNYVVYVDGLPMLIDVGRPTYTRATFSKDRYKSWVMQSAYHNLPTVNGHMQAAGRKFAAVDVKYQANDTLAELRMDIAPAWRAEAGIDSWIRVIRLDREKSLTISDAFKLKNKSADITQSLMTPCGVSCDGAGKLRFRHPRSKTDVIVRFDPPHLEVEIESIELRDDKLKGVWGSHLRRVLLKGPAATSSDTWTVQVLKTDVAVRRDHD